MRIVVSEFITLNGVMEAPHEWSFPYWTEEIGKFKDESLFKVIIEFIAHRAKCYSIKHDDGKQKNTAKGIQHCIKGF